jgi:hypothetical protein
MLTSWHNDNGGGYAAAAPLRAAQATGPPLRPQESLTRSLPRRPAAALDPADLYGPWQTHTAGRPRACPTGARRGTPTELQDHHNRVSTVSGDCRVADCWLMCMGVGTGGWVGIGPTRFW